MRKHLKRHAFPLTALLIIALLFAGYEYHQNKNIEKTLTQEVTRLDQSIQNVLKQQEELSSKLGVAEKDISKLSGSLQEKETQIDALGTQLQQVQVENKEQLGVLEDKITSLKLENQDFSEVIEKSIPAVVSIRTNVGSGSGFLISKNGYVVTNDHVIAGATAATIVTSDDKQQSVLLIGRNTRADIAVLKIEGNNFAWLPFGDSEKITVGEKVIAIGNPGGLDFTVTQGIISAVRREDDTGNNYVQIDVPINPGNSGGPLVNAAGEVIGITTKKISGFEGLGFALESNQVKKIAEGMIEKYEASLQS